MTYKSIALALCWSMLAACPAAAQGRFDLRASATEKFKTIDSNGDGVLDAAEIAAAAAGDFKHHDRDGKGVVAIPTRCRGKATARPRECELAAHDANRDRKLTATEHHRAMRRRVMAADTNRDGKISLNEYLTWTTKGSRR